MKVLGDALIDIAIIICATVLSIAFQNPDYMWLILLALFI